MLYLNMLLSFSMLPTNLDRVSLKNLSVLIALDEFLDTGLDEDSLHVDETLAFCVVRTKDFPF